MIKLFGWEDKIEKRIGDKRLDELKLLRKQRLLVLWNVLAMYVSLPFVGALVSHIHHRTFIPVVTMLATFATYVSDSQVTIEFSG